MHSGWGVECAHAWACAAGGEGAPVIGVWVDGHIKQLVAEGVAVGACTVEALAWACGLRPGLQGWGCCMQCGGAHAGACMLGWAMMGAHWGAVHAPGDRLGVELDAAALHTFLPTPSGALLPAPADALLPAPCEALLPAPFEALPPLLVRPIV